MLNELRKVMGLASRGPGRSPARTLRAQIRGAFPGVSGRRARLIAFAERVGDAGLLEATVPGEPRGQLRGLKGAALARRAAELWRLVYESRRSGSQTLAVPLSGLSPPPSQPAAAAAPLSSTCAEPPRIGPGGQRIAHIIDNKWGLIRELAEGGEGEAWLACDLEPPADERELLDYVVKIASHNPRGVVNELTTALPLTHPNIVRILRFGYVRGALGRELPYIVMRRCGESLEGWIAEGRQPLERVSALVNQVARALDYAHRNQVLHSDVNPGNILVDAEGRARLCDFGLSRVSLKKGCGELSLHTVSKRGHHPYYSAPELRGDGDELRRQSDQYSLALVALALLRGRHIDKPGRRNRILGRLGLPERPHAALKRALSERWQGRFESCEEFAEALDE